MRSTFYKASFFFLICSCFLIHSPKTATIFTVKVSSSDDAMKSEKFAPYEEEKTLEEDENELDNCQGCA